MSKVNVLIQTGYGLNCDIETAHAFALAGASSHPVHINSLVDGSVRLDSCQILVFGGGFSWGDDHGAGVIHAVRLKNPYRRAASGFYRQGKSGHRHLQRISDPGESWPAARLRRGLPPAFGCAHLQRLRQFQGPVGSLKADPDSPCVFTKGMDGFELPVRHGEGKFYAEPAVISRLEENHQVALRYCLPDGTPANGSFSPQPQWIGSGYRRNLRSHRPDFRPHAASGSLSPFHQSSGLDPDPGDEPAKRPHCRSRRDTGNPHS